MEVLVERLVLGLIGANADRAVGRVLQALLEASVALQRQRQGVVDAEREAVLETALERGLDGVPLVPVIGRVLVDAAQAAERAEHVVRE